MLFIGLFIVVIAACVIAIIAVVVRKFPSLSLIDTSTLPRERDARRKQAIIEDRVARMMKERWADFAGMFDPVGRGFKKWFRSQHRKILALERRLERATLTEAQVAEKIARLHAEAEARVQASRWGAAEAKYVDIISWDMGDIGAYAALGEVYLAMKEDEQAKETFLYLLHIRLKNSCRGQIGKLSPVAGGLEAADERSRMCGSTPTERSEIANDYASVATACKQLGQYVAASDAFLNAVAFEPSNPRYLDLLLETCILGGQKVRAKDAFARLKQVNPENQKLSAFEERIWSMADGR